MNAIILIVPILIIRFGLLGVLSKGSLIRASHFAPVIGNEKVAYNIYQISNILLLLYPLFLSVKISLYGVIVYALGVLILTASTISFARPRENGINVKGAYAYSRNPMYVGYFVYFLGCVLLTQSIVLLIGLIFFQLSAHWIILSEERWCIQKFGDEYSSYMKKVRRYV